MTEMIPTLIMVLLHFVAAYGILYFFEHVGEHEYPFDLVIGFFNCLLLTMLAYQWFIGWQDYYNGVYLTITSFYVSMFVAVVSAFMWFMEIAFTYKFVFKESKDVMP